MSSKIWVLIAVTLISIGAGVAVAGIPSGRSVELGDVASVAVTEAPPVTTEVETSTTPAQPTATLAQPTTTTAPPADLVTSTTAAQASATIAPTAPTTRPIVARAELFVVVANDVSPSGAVGQTTGRLLEIGYASARALNGAETFATSAIFAAPGLQAEAEQLAIDVGIDPSLVFPIGAAPELLDSYEEPLLVYLGTDITAL